MAVFLTILIAAAIVAGFFGIGVFLAGWASGDWTPKTIVQGMRKMSIPGQHIIQEYNSLPDSSKPDIDIVSAIESLDARFDKSKLNTHFKSYVYGHFTWTKSDNNNDYCAHGDLARYGAKKCPYNDYVQLHNSIAGVKKELKNQQSKMIEANTQVGYDMVKEINARLAQEREILKSVTKEFL